MAEREKPPRIAVAVPHADGWLRCPWPGADPLYVAYHDEEWGAPEYDDRALFEKLVLDGFRRASRGSPSCASARRSEKRSTASSLRPSCAGTTPRRPR